MVCPKCKGKIYVTDSVHNKKENETYRLKKCINCSHTFFTVECEVIQNQRFKEDWFKNHRSRKKG